MNAARNLSRRPAKPATFAPNPHRRAMLGKVHIAVHELGMDDDDYRAVLQDKFGKTSAADLNEGQLHVLLEHFKSKGWTPTKAARAGKPKRKLADHPSARKARALWISLAQLGAVENGSEEALRAFAHRQLGTELAWSDGARVYKLIEALKAIANRHGWDQDVAGIAPERHVFTLKYRLADALRHKLTASKIVPASWTLAELLANDGVWMGGDTVAHWSLDGLDRAIAHLVQLQDAASR